MRERKGTEMLIWLKDGTSRMLFHKYEILGLIRDELGDDAGDAITDYVDDILENSYAKPSLEIMIDEPAHMIEEIVGDIVGEIESSGNIDVNKVTALLDDILTQIDYLYRIIY